MATIKEVNEKIAKYLEWMELENEAKKVLSELKEEITTYMVENDVDELITESGKCTYREVISKRLDTTSFKKDYAKLYESYQRLTSSMRFTLNA